MGDEDHRVSSVPRLFSGLLQNCCSSNRVDSGTEVWPKQKGHINLQRTMYLAGFWGSDLKESLQEKGILVFLEQELSEVGLKETITFLDD